MTTPPINPAPNTWFDYLILAVCCLAMGFWLGWFKRRPRPYRPSRDGFRPTIINVEMK